MSGKPAAVLAMAALCILAGTAHAGMLVGWDLLNATAGSGSTSTGNAADVTPTAVDASVVSSSLSRGAGFFAQVLQGTTHNGLGAVNWRNSAAPSTLAAAVSSSIYLQFTLTPVSTVALSSMDVVGYQQNTHATSTIAVEFDAGSGYTLAGSVNPIHSGWTGESASVDLSGIAVLQNLATPVSFRLYFYGFGGYEDRGIGEISGSNTDLAVNGTAAAVPEPASLGLLGLGALALVRRRR